jgi:surface antigen
MMTGLKLVAAAFAALALLTACEGSGPKETAGTLLGGAGGAVLGAQFGSGSGQVLAGIAGGLAGAFLGNQIGQSLDKADQAYAEQASQRAATAPIGDTITWNNPDSGNSGTYTPVRDGYDQAGAYCREYQTTVTVGGQVQEAYGTACQQPDGSWKVVN